MGSSASLSPVIIPPAFQAGAGVQRAQGELSPHQAIAAAATAFAQEQAGAQGAGATATAVRPIRTSSGTDLTSTAVAPLPTTPGRTTASGKLPLTPVASAPPVPQAGQNTPPFVGTAPSASPFQAPAPAEARLASGQPAQAGGAAFERRLAAEAAPQPPKPRAERPASASEAPAPESKPARAEAASQKPPPKQKEMTKAERRALQDAQRAKKAAVKAAAGGGAAAGGSAAAPPAAPRPGSRLQRNSSRENLSGPGTERGAASSSGAGAGGAGGAAGAQPPLSAAAAGGANGGGGAAAGGGAPASRPVPRSTELFSHLPPFRATGLEDLVRRGAAAQVPQPALKLGLALAEGRVRGANARCIAMLEVLREVVLSFRSSGPGREAARELQAALNGVISYLVTCRPLSISMGSAIKQVKAALEALKLEPSLPEQEVRDRVAAAISTFVQEKILFASDMVARVAAARVRAGDVIVTYGYSSVVASVLLHAARREGGPDFSVVVVDARPFQEGRRMLRALADARVPAQYVSLNGLNYVLPLATKCLLGAGGVLSNGAVLARVGTAAVGMAASAAHVPVLVACETYKFHERVQLDSFTHNELGDPELIVKTPGRQEQWLKNWQERPGLGLLSLMYDTMPAQFVSMVITELGAIPPTSVPVVLREFRADVAAPA